MLGEEDLGHSLSLRCDWEAGERAEARWCRQNRDLSLVLLSLSLGFIYLMAYLACLVILDTVIKRKHLILFGEEVVSSVLY